MEKTVRRRINVTISTKAIKTWDCTVDCEGMTEEETLAQSDSLVAALEKRYPVTAAVEKEK